MPVKFTLRDVTEGKEYQRPGKALAAHIAQDFNPSFS